MPADPDAKVASWWDYGYQTTAMANRTVIVDNNTWNNTHIATVGRGGRAAGVSHLHVTCCASSGGGQRCSCAWLVSCLGPLAIL
jgi:hypothetical protein